MVPYVLKSARQLVKAGADFIAVPCNTLHEILPEIKKEIKIPFIDLIEETAKSLQIYKKIGILSSKRTREAKLYDDLLTNSELIYPTNEEQEIVSEIIVKIIKNTLTDLDKEKLDSIILNLKNCGAEKVILACTDLANVIKPDNFILDTQEIFIQSVKKRMKED